MIPKSKARAATVRKVARGNNRFLTVAARQRKGNTMHLSQTNNDHLLGLVAPKAPTLLDIDAAAFRDGFNRRPFLIQHRLCEHPLFALPKLLELARRLPANSIDYNAGTIAVNHDHAQSPSNGLSAEETIRRIEECKSWLMLRNVEQDADYRALLHACLDEVRPHSEPIVPGMMQAQGFIFITSPNAVTSYHMDPEHNFLLQIRGSKSIQLFDGSDRSIVTEEDLDRFYDPGHRQPTFQEASLQKSWPFTLAPGLGLHFPVTYPHWVKNGPSVSISFSITFRTPDLERRGTIHAVNAMLRRRGWRPTPVGQSAWRDAVKFQTFRALRRARRLFGFA